MILVPTLKFKFEHSFNTPVMILVQMKWTLLVDVCNQFGGCISSAYNFNTSNNPSTHLLPPSQPVSYFFTMCKELKTL